MAYDMVGNMLSITDSVGNTTSYTYDALDRRITDTNSLGKTRSFGYNAVGDLVSTIDRNGRKISYGYDALDRQISENWLDGNNNTIRTFSYQYDAVGHLLTSTVRGASPSENPSSKYTYTYDLVDRITSIDNLGTAGVPNVLLNYSYDAVGNLLSVTDKINGTQAGTNAYTYDLLNRATRITQSGTGVIGKRVDMSYDAVNRLTGLNRYGDLAGTLGVADSSYVYDAAGRLTNLAHKRGASTIASYGFAYDAANRITRTVGTDGTQDYSYDATNQLTGVDNSALADEAYSYDANGNRTNAGYGTGTNNRLLTDGTYNYEYDSEGNRTKRVEIATGKVTEYVWDYRNRLSSVTFKDAGGVVTKTIEYLYDVNNQRIGKKIDGVTTERYVYDRNQISLVFDGNGNQTHRYLYGTQVDQVLADERGGAVVWALADNLGSVRDVIDGSGTILNHITYDSFGRVVAQTNPAVEFRYGYTGREQDNETGLDYYRARYYDANVGRFISEDPIGFSAGDANLSRYVGNSPTNFIDPSGLDGQEIWGNFQPFNPFTLPMIGLGLIKAFSQGSFDAATKGGVLNAGSVNSGTLPSWVKQNDSNISWSGKKFTARPEDLDPNWWRKNPFIEPDIPRTNNTAHNNCPKPKYTLTPFPGQIPGDKHSGIIPGKSRSDDLFSPFLTADEQAVTGGSLFRGDKRYKAGPIGHPIGSEEWENATVTKPWEHVIQAEKGHSSEISRFTSFSELLEKTRKFTDKNDRHAIKILREELSKLEQDGAINIYTPEKVRSMMEESSKKKIRINANNVYDRMIENNEVLIEGQIPANVIKRVK